MTFSNGFNCKKRQTAITIGPRKNADFAAFIGHKQNITLKTFHFVNCTAWRFITKADTT